jgi:hypothetical protein
MPAAAQAETISHLIIIILILPSSYWKAGKKADVKGLLPIYSLATGE